MDNQRLPYPEPAEDEPDFDMLIEWVAEGVCEATDGCFPVEPDGWCEHGFPSWLLQLGLI